MSEDVRKNCRTQGKYSDKSQYCEDKRPPKSRDKRQKVSPAAKEPQEKKFHKRRSDGSKGSNTSLVSESDSPVRYEENSDHVFSQLDDTRKQRIEIKSPGRHVLSTTQNGESVVYYEPFCLETVEANDLLNRLLDTTNWHTKNIVIHGVEYPQPRLVAWYGPFPYSYSGATLEPAEMPGCVLAIKAKVEEYLKSNGIDVTLNSVLLNLYRHNKDSVSWHSDDEMTMGVCPTIASVSLGETRKFEMRRKFKHFEDEGSHAVEDEYFVNLTHGSLLIMDGSMQSDWQHRVPKEYHDRDERINLTFRTVYELENLPFVPDNQPIDSAIRKSHRSKFNYDEKSFPPLNTDTSPMCYKGIANNPNEINQDRSGLLKADNQLHESEEVWDSEPSSYNETPVQTDDSVNTSQEMWDCESSNNMTPVKTGDRIIGPEAEWEIESPYSKKSTLNNLNDDRKSAKIDIQSKNLHTYDSSLSGNNAINSDANAGKNKNFSMEESHSVSSNSPVSSTEVNVYEVKSEIVQNKNLRAYDSSVSNYNAMNVDTNAGKNKNFSRKESRGVSSNSPTSNTEVNVDEVKSEPMQMMIDMQNKNLHADNSTDSNYYGMNFDANAGKNRNFNMKESYTVSSKSSINNNQQNAYKVKDEPRSSTGHRWTPNVEAKEFVPTCSTSYEKCTIFGSFGLENLLNYNIEVMPMEDLFDYSFALRDRVMEKIHEFRYTDELEMLCQLTDGNQTQRNQKIITTRMCVIVDKALKRQQTSPNIRKSFGISRQSNHGNQNHYSERNYSERNHQGRNRGSYHRY